MNIWHFKNIVNSSKMFCFISLGTLCQNSWTNCLVQSAKKCLVPLPTQLPINGHDYTASLYHECGKASSFTTFVNKGGLQIPSTSVFRTIQYCEHIFRSTITGENSQYISHESNLKQKMIIQVCQHFSLDSTKELFPYHEEGLNEMLLTRR